MDKIKLPAPFNDVIVDVWCIHNDDEVRLRYFGMPEDLIASGACEEQMFAKKEKRCTPRFDSEGHRYCTDSYFVSRGGEPVRRFKVTRYKPRASALRLPGALEAIACYEGTLLETDLEYRRKEREVQKEHARQQELQEQKRREEYAAMQPSTVAQWKEDQLYSGALSLRSIYRADSRRRSEEYVGSRFTLCAEDAARLEALGSRFHAEFEALIRAASVEDLRPGSKERARSALRLVVNNQQIR